MGPDAPLPTDEKIRSDDHNEDVVGDEDLIKRNPSAINPLDALGLDDWRAVEKKVVRRLDMTILPMLWVLYLSNYLDRTNIAQARLNDFDQNLNLGPQGYNTAVALLTVGYMIGQLPSNMLLTRVRPGIYLSGCALIWSVVSACTAAANNETSLFVIRFFLGLTEAPLFPGAVFILSAWYTRKELALRITILYSGLVLGQACSGLIAAGVFYGLSNVNGLYGWQWLFILEAASGAAVAILAFFVIPDFPHSKTGAAMWYMTDEMRAVATARMQADRVSESESDNGVMYGVKLCVKDYKLYVFCFFNLCMTSSYGFNFFFPTIVNGLGFGVEQDTSLPVEERASNHVALLMTAPPYIFAAFVSFAFAWNSDRIKDRSFHIIPALCLSVVGFVITVSTLNNAARYFAAFLFTPGSFSANPLVYTWAVSTMNTTPEKRAAAGAIINMSGHVGNIISPYFFDDGQAPRYLVAFIIMMAFAVVTLLCALFTRWRLIIENKALKRKADETGGRYVPFTL
ncbi:hypothetical protein Q7P35_008608 [Cladosporium inversicolor]